MFLWGEDLMRENKERREKWEQVQRGCFYDISPFVKMDLCLVLLK